MLAAEAGLAAGWFRLELLVGGLEVGCQSRPRMTRTGLVLPKQVALWGWGASTLSWQGSQPLQH